ncbi:MAG: arginyltransferase [Myxococcota bacterium]
MARLLQHIVSPPSACSYLPDQQSTMENKVMLDVTPQELELMLTHGWRRFGPTYFRPTCSPCTECISLRIPVETFRPTRSQRRAWRKCRGIRVQVGAPTVDDERLRLYRAWHAAREDARGWNDSSMDEETYFLQFCFPHPCARELSYWLEDRLVAVGICDETPHCLSSVYFFYHPDEGWRSLGVASVLFELDYARARRIPHLYMGYRVRECPSLKYKATFGPHELLVGRPALEEEPVWVPAGDEEGREDEPATE